MALTQGAANRAKLRAINAREAPMSRLLLLLGKGNRTLTIMRTTRGNIDKLFKLKPVEVDELIAILTEYRAVMKE